MNGLAITNGDMSYVGKHRKKWVNLSENKYQVVIDQIYD